MADYSDFTLSRLCLSHADPIPRWANTCVPRPLNAALEGKLDLGPFDIVSNANCIHKRQLPET